MGVLVTWGVASHWHAPAAVADVVHQTQRARQSSIILRDGTRVVLAPDSKLTVSGEFGRSNRLVMLSGEAYFTVVSSSHAPFVVRTGTVSTRVLGTIFDIRHYPADTDVQLSVASGRVVSAGRRSSVTVSAGQMARVTDSTAVTASADAAGVRTNWTRGELVFDELPVSTVLATVGRWYGYRFKLSDSTLAAQHISVTIRTNDARDMMLMLKDVLDVTMTFDDSVITLLPRRPVTRSTRGSRSQLTPSMEKGR
jgi:transmembrane sensor